jgi:DNA-binding NarL/FixJ family response regulator
LLTSDFGIQIVGEAQQLEQRQHAERRAANVLVVDGDPVYAEFIIAALTRAGFVGHHLASGEKALEAVRELSPAAVILEVILPGTTGYEICTELRQRYGDAKSSGSPAHVVPASPAFSRLTARENEVLRLLARGLDQGEIAQQLAISPATVGTHIQRILTKLDVHSRTQAVALAYREKLVDQA